MNLLPRACLDCGQPTRDGSRCHRCLAATYKAEDQRRGNRHQRGYTNDWARLAKEAIRRQPWCTDCGHWGSTDNPLTGDHLRWPAETLDDVDVVCKKCNSRRGAKRSMIFDKAGTGTAGMPREAITHPYNDHLGLA
jgi:hypothetical protein